MTEWQNDRITELQNYRMTELQNDRMTDRTKTICPPIFDLGGIKRGKNKPSTCIHLLKKSFSYFHISFIIFFSGVNFGRHQPVCSSNIRNHYYKLLQSLKQLLYNLFISELLCVPVWHQKQNRKSSVSLQRTQVAKFTRWKAATVLTGQQVLSKQCNFFLHC